MQVLLPLENGLNKTSKHTTQLGSSSKHEYNHGPKYKNSRKRPQNINSDPVTITVADVIGKGQ